MDLQAQLQILGHVALGQLWLSLGVTVLAYATLHLVRRLEARIARR